MTEKTKEQFIEELAIANDRIKELEQKLTAVQEENKVLFDNAIVCMFRTFIKDGSVLAVNSVGVRMFGYVSAEEFISEFRASEHYADPDGRAQLFVALKEKGYIKGFETRMTRKDGTPFWVEVNVKIYPDEGYIEGAILDIDERKQTQHELIETQKHIIQELSVPIIPVMEDIIVMPLIGSIDSMRASDIMRTLLAGISKYRAKIVILDITGVPIVDTGVAAHLDKTVQAARLKGARTIITGISDAVAETIVDLGIDWSRVETLRDLQTGLVVALDSLGMKLKR
jgi:PAS domain S-box-containing protein